MIAHFTTAVLAWLTLVIDMTVQAFSGVVEIFYDNTIGFTIYGLLLIFGLAVGFVGLAIGFIRGLISK